MVKLQRKASQSPSSGHHPLGKRGRRNVVRPGNFGKLFFKPGCPSSTLELGLCPPTPPHSHTVGMWDAAGTDLLSLPMPPPSSLLPAGPTAIYSCCNIPIPSSLPFFFPQGAWNPLAIMTKAHLWLCLLDPCAHLCCCSGNNLWVGCRAVFPSSFQGAAAGEAAQTQRESHGWCRGMHTQQFCASLWGCLGELFHHREFQKCNILLEAH